MDGMAKGEGGSHPCPKIHFSVEVRFVQIYDVASGNL